MAIFSIFYGLLEDCIEKDVSNICSGFDDDTYIKKKRGPYSIYFMAYWTIILSSGW